MGTLLSCIPIHRPTYGLKAGLQLRATKLALMPCRALRALTHPIYTHA